jgi:enoyl-CoA hydratase/carnithine racemase
VRVLVLRGAGRAFSTGGDLREFGSAPSPVVARAVRFQRDVWGRLLELRAATLAAVHGPTVGGGMEMMLLCDVRIAASDTRMALPETGLGMIPGVAGTQTLPRAVGLARAHRRDADGPHGRRALRRIGIGLVHRVVPRARLLPTRSRRGARVWHGSIRSSCRRSAAPCARLMTSARRRGSSLSATEPRATSPPIMNTVSFLAIPAGIVPDQEAIVSGADRFTYDDTMTRVRRLAGALAARRREARQPRRRAQTRTRTATSRSYYATAMLGGVFVPVNYRAKRPELEHMLKSSEAQVLFVGERYLPEVDSAPERAAEARDARRLRELRAAGCPRTRSSSRRDRAGGGSRGRRRRHEHPHVHERHDVAAERASCCATATSPRT